MSNKNYIDLYPVKVTIDAFVHNPMEIYKYNVRTITNVLQTPTQLFVNIYSGANIPRNVVRKQVLLDLQSSCQKRICMLDLHRLMDV